MELRLRLVRGDLRLERSIERGGRVRLARDPRVHSNLPQVL